MKVTYLLIKSSVLSVTDQQSPEKKYPLCREKMHPDAIEECDLGSKMEGKCLCYNYDQAMKAFNESFIKVENADDLTGMLGHTGLSHVVGTMTDGLYPAPEGIEFKPQIVCHEPCGGMCGECKHMEKVAVVSLIGDKEERPPVLKFKFDPNAEFTFEEWQKISEKKRPEDTKDNKAWAGAWLEGEMVGYAKCMVKKVLASESFTARELEIAFCVGMLNQKDLDIDKLSDQLNHAKFDLVKDWIKNYGTLRGLNTNNGEYGHTKIF